ncbi:MAG TPA: PEP-CTERM system histidine kinase PrsK [Deltaproteobacteria bacterium]|nr:PEP-CTERM system histidine kinase PrsK [Deltaproteobacteria bacterium]
MSLYAYLALLPAASVVLCASLGLFTLSRNPRNPANIGLFGGLAALTVVETGAAFMLLHAGDATGLVAGARLAAAGMALLPPLWLVFTLSFARSEPAAVLRRWSPVLAAFTLLSLVFIYIICLHAPSPLRAVQPSLFAPSRHTVTVSTAGRYLAVYVILGLLPSLAHLENTLRSSTGGKRWSVKYIVFGVGAVLVFFVYLASQMMLLGAMELELMATVSAVILISVSLLAVFIIRYRLMDVDIFISRYVVYNSLVLLIVGIYLIAVGLIAHGIKYFDLPFDYFVTTLFVFAALLLLMVLLFNTQLRRRFQLFINRHFYSHKYEFRDKWMETIERLGSCTTVAATADILVEMISETMGTKKVFLWLHEPGMKRYRLIRPPDENSSIGEDHPIVRHLSSRKRPFFLKEAMEREKRDEEAADALERLAEQTGAVLCAPLAAGDELLGFTLQQPDLSGEEYRQDDFDILGAFTAQAAVQIKNAILTDDLMDMKAVEGFHKMSSFIMHDLKNLTNSLSLVSQNARHNMDNPDFQRDAIKTVDGTVRRMKELIGRLSTIRKGLELRREPTDLSAVIEEAVAKTVVPPEKEITLTRELREMGPVMVDPMAMEMVLVNLISNACDAIACRGRVHVSSEASDGFARIEVSDDGEGMSAEFMEHSLFKPFMSTKSGGIGIGLYQCKIIVEAHKGRIEAESEEGRGTTFTIRLPL